MLSIPKNIDFIYFSKKKKSYCPENVHTYSTKYTENKKITFLENVKKIKNIPIRGGGPP